MIEAKAQVHASTANTIVARLTHARLFGTDSPYDERTTDNIREEMRQIERRYFNHNQHFLFSGNGIDLQQQAN